MTKPTVSSQNIVRSPIVLNSVDTASRLAYHIALLRENVDGELEEIGKGTGFLHQRDGRDYLITCWHVASGRNPSKPSHFLPGYPAEPTSFELYLPFESNPNHYVPAGNYPLYLENGQPNWIETKIDGANSDQIIDVVAIPIDFSDLNPPPLITRIEDIGWQDNMCLRIGRDVITVGYPFGIRKENPYPIWKRGFVASEPSLLIDGMPKYYVDSPGRPGMSGAPMFMISAGIGVPKSTHDLLDRGLDSALEMVMQLDPEELINAPETNILQFAGVYSGSFGDGGMDDMRLGLAWSSAVVDMLFSKPMPGSTHV